VSTASPYRHFADRDHLLAAVAAQAALELAGRIRADVEVAGADPVERFAITAGTYVRFVADRGAGFDVIFSSSLTHVEDAGLIDARRGLFDLLLGLAEEASPQGQALPLYERHLVSAHGYVTLYRDGFFTSRRPRDTVETIAERAVQAGRALVV
jgi:AcrR family transcriptional regulator